MRERKVAAGPTAILAALLGAVVGATSTLWLSHSSVRRKALLGPADLIALAALMAVLALRYSGPRRWRRALADTQRNGGDQARGTANEFVPALVRSVEAMLSFLRAEGAALLALSGSSGADVAAAAGSFAKPLLPSRLSAADLNDITGSDGLVVCPTDRLHSGHPLRGTEAGVVVACPVGSGDGPRLILVTHFARTTSLSARHRRRILQLVRIAADDVDRAQLDDAERRSRLEASHARRHLAMLASASATLAVALEDWRPALEGLATEIVPVHADFFAVDLAFTDGRLSRVASAHIDPAFARLASRPASSFPGWIVGVTDVVRSGRPVVFPNVKTARARMSRPAPADDLQGLCAALDLDSWAVLPIRNRGLSLGVVTVGTTSVRRGLRASDVAAFEELASRVAVTLERVLLYRDNQDAAQRAQRNADRLAKAVEASTELSASLRHTDALKSAATQTLRTMGGIQAAVSVQRPGHPPLIVGWPDPAPDGGTAAELAARADPMRQDEDGADEDDAHSWIASPIAVPGSETTGRLVLRGVLGHRYSAEEESVLVLLAQMTSAAFGHAELYEARADSERRLRALVDASPLAILELDTDGTVLDWNRAALALLGGPGDVASPVLVPAARALLLAQRERLESGERIVDEPVLLPRQDGTTVEVSLAAALVGRERMLCVVSDITERRLLEREVQQQRRMEAIGRLAGGVAHDFNNLLTVIVGYSDLLANRLGEDHPLFPDVDAVRAAGRRAATFTEQLLTISRSRVGKTSLVDLSAAVADLEGVLSRLIGEDIALETDLEASGHIAIDVGQLEQVILNLVVNARQAMPQGGLLSIATRSEVDEDQRVETLTVVDTGVGMDATVLERCFEPFFTTRGRGLGTGLGLATVYGVVEQAQGRISVESNPGHGTKLRIAFPSVSPGAVAGIPGKSPDDVPAVGTATVLLVEDDPAVRTFACQVLEEAGYTVHSAANGEDALRSGQHVRNLDIVITDVVLPGIGGVEVAAALTVDHPRLPVLFVSGYIDDSRQEQIARDQQVSRFLAKPFTSSLLLQAVGSLLQPSDSVQGSNR